MIEIVRYNKEMCKLWDEAVASSRNGTFLHMRGFMDYHSDRFDDHSLLAMDKGRVVAVLPANRRGTTVYSHQGLTYGGWLVADCCDMVAMMEVTDAAVAFLKADGVDTLVYKPVPHIYHRYPAEEDIYALHRHGAVMTECNISTVVDLAAPLRMDRGNRSAVNRARREGITVGESQDLEGYWKVLSDVLGSRHGAAPVHTVEEMALLQSRFPDNIKLYTACLDGEIVAGVVMFFTAKVAHCQYIASSPSGREHKALSLLFDTLMGEASKQGVRYFDFGTSNEDHGRYLNEGLVTQKARLGGRGITYNVFTLKF